MNPSKFTLQRPHSQRTSNRMDRSVLLRRALAVGHADPSTRKMFMEEYKDWLRHRPRKPFTVGNCLKR